MQKIQPTKKVKTEQEKDNILEILSDHKCRLILKMIMKRHRNAEQISQKCDIPLGIVHRKIKFLDNKNILWTSFELNDKGEKNSSYMCKFREISAIYNGSVIDMKLIPNDSIKL